MITGKPNTWPEDHKWSVYWDDVTCPACLEGREEIKTFTIGHHGSSITCLKCRRTSYLPQDVKFKYCGHCNVFHEDLWPPARKAWLKK